MAKLPHFGVDEEEKKKKKKKIQQAKSTPIKIKTKTTNKKAKAPVKRTDDSTRSHTFNYNKDVKQKKKRNPLSFILRKTGNEVYGGVAGIEQAGSTEAINALQKGQKSKKKGTADTLQTFAEASFLPIHMLNSTIEAGKNFAKSKKSTKDKLINLALDLSDSTINTKGIELVGKLAPKKATKEAIKNIKEADEFVSKPYEKNAEKLNEESANYGQGTNFVADTMGVVGRMGLPIAVSAITKKPIVGRATMSLSAKGSSTKEALNRGADLDTATKMGTAKGWVEYGTEGITSGAHIFGGGALDDIAEKGIQKTLSKVGGQGVKHAILDKGLHALYDVLGENLEEWITDVVDTQIDKATVDPKAKYTLADWGQTTALTTASTIVLNLLTRGMVGGVRVDMDKAINQTENQLNTKFTDKEKNILKDNALKDLMYKNAYDKAQDRIQENKKLINKKVQEAMTLNQNKTLNTTEAQRNKINDAINIKTAEIQALKQQNKLLTDRLENNENFNSLGRYKSNDSKLARIEQAIPSEMYDTPINIETIEQNQYDNDSRVANLLVSARQNLNNSEVSQSFVKMLSNLVENKGYNIVFNPDMGENINGRIVTNENAKTIELNPNSDKSATFVLMHELSHDIGTQEISEDINNFRGENVLFDEWYKNREQLYREQTNLSEEEIQEEMMCDSIGELLGNEEYLNHLTTKPTLMQKIMDWINKFLGRTEKGSQEYNYLQQLKQDFEKAYNGEETTANVEKNSINLVAKYDPQVYNNLQEDESVTNTDRYWVERAIMQNPKQRGDFVYDLSVNGKYKVYQASRYNYKIYAKLEEGKRLYEAGINERNAESGNEYESSGISDLATENLKSGKTNDGLSNFNKGQNDTSRTSNIESKPNSTSKNSQELESSFSLDKNYRGSHQIENAKSITDLDINDIQNKVIETDGYLTKQSESDLRKLKKIMSSNEKVKIYRASPVNELNSGDWVTTDKAYAQNVANNNGGKVHTYEVEANQLYYPDNVSDLPSLHRLSSFQYNENTNNGIKNSQNLSEDNQGRTLSKEQQDYFKDSKVRDENGNLKVTYHNTTDEVKQFNKFDSREYYNNYDEPNILWFTDSEEVASSYSDGNYKIATKDNNDTNLHKYQYQTYLNITNPYVVDCEGRNYTRALIDEKNSINYTSEGVVDLVLEKNKNGANYDGIIFKNILDYSDEYDGNKIPHDDYVVFNSNQIKNIDNTNPTTNDDIRYSRSLKETNTGKDSDENKLSKQQQKYFENTKVLDDNGNLLKVYHTTSGEDIPFGGIEFFELNPVGTYGYKFGDQVVNFFTDSQEMSGSYVDQNYVPVDTSKFTSLEEVQGLLDYFNSSDLIEYSIKEKNGKYELYDERENETLHTFDSKEDLFKNIKPEIQRNSQLLDTFGQEADGYQYEGYVNITNPYVVDAKGKNWNDIILDQNNENVDKMYNSLTEQEKDYLSDLADKMDNMYSDHKESVEAFYQRLGANNETLYNKVTPESSIREKLYDTALYQWPDTYVKDLIGKRYTTNDIVKQALENNENGANYDGVIIKNVVDYGGKSESSEKPNNLYITFNSNQFKAWDNETPTNDSDIRYSQNLNEEEARNFATELADLDPEVMAQAFLEKEGDRLKAKARENGTILTDKQLKQLYRQHVGKISPENAFRIISEAISNRNYEIDRLSKITKNNDIKFWGDHINNMQGEIETNLNTAQIDENGNVVGKPVVEIFEPYTKDGRGAMFNDYLFHRSNIERHNNGVGSQVPMEESIQAVKDYEKENPDFKAGGDEVNNYFVNLLNFQVRCGIISQETANNILNKYKFYVPFYENEYLDDTFVGKTSDEIRAGSTLKRAQGGADKNLMPFEEAMARQTQQAISNGYKNELYKQIVNSLPKKAIDIMENLNPNESNALIQSGKKHYLTAFENGTPVQTEISQELYNELNKTFENYLKSVEKTLSFITKPLQKGNEIKRNLVTTWSPSFIVTNPTKDVQDAFLNTKYPKDFAKYYPIAFKDLLTGKDTTGNMSPFLYKYGKPNIMGDASLDLVNNDISNLIKDNGKINKSALAKVAKKIPQINEILEMAPRYAEYLASLENGCSQLEALYNAREVTVNFGRGGWFVKFLNRNGATFLNAQVQGFSKFFRNFHDAPVRTSLRATAYGLSMALINQLMYGDDDDYDLLPDYIKDNYYLFKVSSNEELKAMPKDMKEKYLIKKGKATFIRIPRGRMLSIFSSMINRGKDRVQGKRDELTLGEDIKSWGKNAWTQVGLPDIGSTNLFAPIDQARKNKTWYGGQLVPKRLMEKDGKKIPAKQQYDASTDKISIWLGQKTGWSPYKINYVLDQYTGGIGDMLIPLITEEAQSSSNSIVGTAIAPLKDKFTADTINDNKNVTNFYTKAEKMGTKSLEDNATGKDKLKSGYMDNVSYQMGALYKQIRDVQADKNLSKKEKYERYEVLKAQINELAKNGLKNVNNVKGGEFYGEVDEGGKKKQLFKSAKGNYYELYDNQKEALDNAKLNVKERNNLYKTKNEVSNYLKTSTDKDKYSKRYKIIKDSDNSQSAKAVLYNQNKQFYQKDPTSLVKDNLVDSFLDIESQNIKSDYKNGKIVYNSKRNKIAKAINKLDLSNSDKVKLFNFYYPNAKLTASGSSGSGGTKRRSGGSKSGARKGNKKSTTKTPKITRTKVTPVKLSNNKVKIAPVKSKSTSNSKYYQEALKNLLFK